MQYLTMAFQLLIALPKIWAILKELNAWLSKQKAVEDRKEQADALKEMKTGKTKKEREDAADRFLDND